MLACRAYGRPRFRRIPGVFAAADRVERHFPRDQRDELWVTDITEHRTREGKVYCAVVSTPGRAEWSDGRSTPRRALRSSHALGMAIEQRRPKGDTIISQRQGTQYTSGAYTAVLDSGLVVDGFRLAIAWTTP